MMRPSSIVGVALRSAAIAIALVAAIDPAVTSARTGKPTVSVVAADSPRDSLLADRVARTLSKQFTVYRAPFAAADGAVLVGNRLPSDMSELPKLAFAVTDAEPGVSIEAVRAPASAPAGSRVPVESNVRVIGARGRTVDVTLRAGDLVVDRITRTVSSDDERVPVALTYVPPATGSAALTVSAKVDGIPDAYTDVAIDVRDDRWAVLFFDARPSWMSTFVRRAVERDPRFVVTSRVVTSRNLSTDAGRPPSRLDDLASLELFDAIVVGAPESLGEADVAGLDAFMRRRGGSVVLLLDRRASGPYERLAAVDIWVSDSGSRTVSVLPVGGDTAGLRASELAYPRRLPNAALTLAVASSARTDSANGRAMIWRAPVGAGRVVVSGALDAWRYRDHAVSAFDRFWQTTLGDLAAASPPPMTVSVSRPVMRPGESADVNVSVRDATLSSASSTRASVEARLESDSGAAESIRLWPSTIGTFTGTVRAPRAGSYRIVAVSDGARATTPLIVSNTVARPTPDDRDLVDALVRARGGRSVASSKLDELPGALASAIRPTPRAETWHPMRSAWWIVPFALALSADWWMRRRRGLS